MIDIDDDNDNAPEFPVGLYSISMPENQPIGTSVMEVVAEDLDIGENARLEYTITTSGDGDHFFMDSVFSTRTGVVKIHEVWV